MAGSLHKAKKAKNDEFYTRYKDIAEEMGHYREHFRDKVIYCNCDDPTQSNFGVIFITILLVLVLKNW